jgi:hypothetical protein
MDNPEKTGNIGYIKPKKNKAKTQHNNIHRDVHNVFGHCNVLLCISYKTTYFFQNIIPKTILV